MNQSALEGFVKIVEMDSFSAAAEALYLSQSALSQQIRTLEGQLQFELFQHVPRRVILTPAGRDFYPKAKQLVGLISGGSAPCPRGAAAGKPAGTASGHRMDAMRRCGCSCTTCFL